jgi:hypothetical protein
MFFCLGQSAWEGNSFETNFSMCYRKIHSSGAVYLKTRMNVIKSIPSVNTKHATKLQLMPSHQRLNVGHPDGFADWLAGLVDGDGTFWFNQSKKGTWDFTFKVSQSNYNLKLLAYLKKKLKCGSITVSQKNHSQFRIRNPEILKNGLLPLFDNKLLTRSKCWDFLCIKEALEIYCNPEIAVSERNSQLLRIKEKQKQLPKDFEILHLKNSSYPPKGWVLGFTEAEGSFYLVQKSMDRIVHGLGWIQKHEKELLESLRLRFHLKVQVKKHSRGPYWMLDTTSSKAVIMAIEFFEKNLKGMKAVEVSKWARSFRKYKNNFEKLQKLQKSIRQSKKFE